MPNCAREPRRCRPDAAPLNLLRALSTVSGMTLLSRITGLARESLKAATFGAGVQMDAFEAAFRLPNILRRLFAEGAFSQAFVPIFAEYRRQRGDEETRELIGRVGTLLAVGLLVVCAPGRARRAWLVYVLACGFARTPGKVELTAQMIRIVFPYILFVSLVSLAGGVLNVYRRFAIPAFTPVLLNRVDHRRRACSSRRTAIRRSSRSRGACSSAASRSSRSRSGRWRRSACCRGRASTGATRACVGCCARWAGDARRVGGADLRAHQHAARRVLGDGRISWITYADRLMEFPSALLGVALGTVLLPSLAKHARRREPGRVHGRCSTGACGSRSCSRCRRRSRCGSSRCR